MNLERLFKYVYRLSTIMLLWGACVVVYWTWFDKPDVVSGISITVVNPDSVYPGGNLRVRSKGCNQIRPLANSATRIIRNEFTFILSDTSVRDRGCFDRVAEYSIPLDAHEGPHSYQFCAEYLINPLRTVLYCTQQIPFNVKPRVDGSLLLPTPIEKIIPKEVDFEEAKKKLSAPQRR